MPITRATWSATYAEIPNVYRKRFIDGATSIQPVHPLIFKIEGSNQSKEYFSDFVGLGQWTEVGEGAEIPESTPQEVNESYLEHVKYASKISWTEEAMSDGKYNEIAQIIENMGIMAVHLLETNTANHFNRAFNASYTGMDGKELCATDHPLSGTGGTEQNELSTPADLAYSSWEQFEIDMAATTDEMGQLSPYYPEMLLIPTALRVTANQIFGSAVVSSEMQYNVYQNAGVQIVVWPFLTDSDAFFALDRRHMMKLFWRWPVAFRRWPDYATMAEKYAGFMRYISGWFSWRGVFGTPGAA